jgi:hypothetical protein
MNNPTQPHSLPCVVQLGFAGSRKLFVDPQPNPPQLMALQEEVEHYLTERLNRLREELNLERNYFLVGISQIACGADTLFTRACRSRRIPQRIFLPQHRDAYLSAVGSDGITADFTTNERKEAELLLGADHIIQERIVSDSADRQQQFEDVNVENPSGQRRRHLSAS